jgi:hypothetical protein
VTDLNQAEYEALRDTIRDRGTARLCAVLAGFIAWGALVIALRMTDLEGAILLVPFVVLVATFEVNFFIHTGVERIGRYLQVFYEEQRGTFGWETTAMNLGAKFPSGLDPLFAAIFATAAGLNFLSSLAVAHRHPTWTALSLVAHLAFAYRIVAARKLAGAQRALDLDRFRGLLSK